MKGKTLAFIAFFACMATFGYVMAEQGDYDTLGYSSSGGYAFWRVDSSGHLKPGVASTLDIGTSALPVRTIYAGTISGAVISSGGAATLSTTTFTGEIKLFPKTLAQLNAMTPDATGQMFYCSDCVSPIAISTGVQVRAFSTIASSGTHIN